ncbi:MAG TPA: hypothetical protein VN289_24625 [Paraburkholderia sp.]|nr:hypothetical protein [Paraburkholderia sp.]
MTREITTCHMVGQKIFEALEEAETCAANDERRENIANFLYGNTHLGRAAADEAAEYIVEHWHNITEIVKACP